MSKKSKNDLECNKFLANFYSSELSTHGRLVIGFAAIIFTISQIALGVSQKFTPLSSIQYWIIFFWMLIISSGFCYVLMRMLVYGILSSYALHIPLENFTAMHNKVEIECSRNGKILMFIPVSWFMWSEKNTLRRRFAGIFLICIVPSILISFSLMLVLELTTIQVLFNSISNIFWFL